MKLPYSTLLFSLHLFHWCVSNGIADSDLPGHLQPLGSHMPPQFIRSIDYIPNPLEFYRSYVSPKTPLLMEGIMKNTKVLKNWQDDEYLRSNFGELEMGIEEGKKENRSHFAFSTFMSDFLDVYYSEDIYLVSDLPEPMLAEWEVPKFLQCGGYMDYISHVNIWFSSGGTKSVLHSDSYENLHCLVSGRKEFILIEPHYSELIGPEHQVKGFYDIDVEKVDMTVYPNLAKVPWYKVTVNEGDCLYLPYQWLHHVHSTGRNMGINIWWSEFMEFNPRDCSDADQLPDFVPFGDQGIHPELEIREGLSELAREDGKVYLRDVYNALLQQFPGITLEHVKQMMDILEPGCNGVIEDLKSIPPERLREALEYTAMTAGEVLGPGDEEDLEDWGEDYPYWDEQGNQLEQHHPEHDHEEL